MKVTDVVFRQDLYPRFEHDQSLIERYANAIEQLPPIIVNQNNILIDGFHRWKAHQLAKVDEVPAAIQETESESALEVLAYRYNSQHGAQLKSDEKKIFAQKKVGVLSVAEISEILSVSARTVSNWTSSQREAIKKERNRRIMEEYLRAWNTQEKVAELAEVDQKTVSNLLESFRKNGKLAEIPKDFKPYLYATWNIVKADKETGHFGYFQQV